MCAAFERLRDYGDPHALGVSIPGLVDEDAGIAVYSVHLDWQELPFARLASERLGVPARLGQDVRTGLLGEVAWGAARGLADVIFIALGGGLAVAALSGGRPVTAMLSGELGHVVVDPAGPPCKCGRQGCVESICSARGIARAASLRLGEEVSAEDVVARMAAGDPTCTAVWNSAINTLAGALAPVAATLGSTHIIIGGGLAAAGSVLFDTLQSDLNRRLPVPQDCLVVPGLLQDRASSLGAGCLALRELAAL